MSLSVEFYEIGPITGATPVQVDEDDFLARTSGDAAAFAIKHGCEPTNKCIRRAGRYDYTNDLVIAGDGADEFADWEAARDACLFWQ